MTETSAGGMLRGPWAADLSPQPTSTATNDADVMTSVIRVKRGKGLTEIMGIFARLGVDFLIEQVMEQVTEQVMEFEYVNTNDKNN